MARPKPGDEDRYHPQPRDPPTARPKEEDASADLSVKLYGSELLPSANEVAER